MDTANHIQTTRDRNRSITAEAPVTLKIPLPVLAGAGGLTLLAVLLLR